MPSSKSKNTIITYFRCSIGWLSVDELADIPPSNDALKFQILLCTETHHVFGTHEDACERFDIPHTKKVITIRPSELCNEDIASIKQSDSIRMIEDIINTQYSSSEREIKLHLIVDRAIELVRNKMMESPHGLPPNCVLEVKLLEGIMIVHDTSDKKVLDYVEATKCGTCSICTEDFLVGHDGSRLPCLHIFHGICISNWLLRKNHCPICRCPVPAKWITWF